MCCSTELTHAMCDTMGGFTLKVLIMLFDENTNTGQGDLCLPQDYFPSNSSNIHFQKKRFHNIR